ncbi:MAG: HAMP domain-containing histidine kinase [Flexistipes sinusarabici]|uniref:histidine kinase n=1 Tax=Flexistipes sinusarabici TaxID=2352 RepID=A0A5D0MHE1_FLESI|nr:HAMP domain-containing sensor histidine kinase [Flexistipes sinusarabici]TYB33087.1 MAG: HAMP domain-containing histidine kinase [Flexistipes sinusarabici]
MNNSENLLFYITYLFYGLAFFTLAVSIFSKNLKISKLYLAKILWLMGLFGLSHAVHEWLELYLKIAGDPAGISKLLKLFQISNLSLSYLLILFFGIFLLKHLYPKIKKIVNVVAVAVPVFVIILIVVYINKNFPSSFYEILDYVVRNFLGFPSGLIAGFAIIVYAASLNSISSKGSKNFYFSGLWLILYAVSTGLIPTDMHVTFFSVNIIIVRALTAFGLLFFLIKALRTFDIEQYNIIEKQISSIAEAEKMASLGKLAAGIAHEVNTPLTKASLNIELMKNNLEKDNYKNHTLYRRIDNIEKNIDKASRIAKELLYFSRTQDEEFQRVPMKEVVENALSLLQSNMSKVEVKISIRADLYIDCIPWKIEEVFVNNIMNSLEAIEYKGWIKITAQKVHGETKVFFEDSGEGISDEIAGKLFEPFFTTKKPGKGTGLGLYICYDIMQKHNGEIKVEKRMDKNIIVLVFPEN